MKLNVLLFILALLFAAVPIQKLSQDSHLFLGDTVYAQDATAAAEAPLLFEALDASSSGINTDQIYTKPRQTAEILRLRELYQDQVERYTNQEREFYINKAQFEKLNTLQSLEEAVKAGREVMISRDDVLITYFELMRASLNDTEGVELTERQITVDLMVGYIQALKDHREKVIATNNREGIAARADEFAQISVEFESTAYRSLALIRLGDIQTVYDKSLIIYKDVLAYHKANPTSPLKQAERERAYREVDKTIEQVKEDLRVARTAYSNQKAMNRSSYNSNIVSGLSKVYSGTSQFLAFIEELFVELT